jgi:hypothetical protein
MTIKAALEALTIPFAHYSWQGTPPAPYGTWGEDGAAETVFAEGAHQERADSVSVDLFTRDDTGADAAAVEQALSGVTACAWELEAVQYEHPTGLVHYTWAAEVVRGVGEDPAPAPEPAPDPEPEQEAADGDA